MSGMKIFYCMCLRTILRSYTQTHKGRSCSIPEPSAGRSGLAQGEQAEPSSPGTPASPLPGVLPPGLYSLTPRTDRAPASEQPFQTVRQALNSTSKLLLDFNEKTLQCVPIMP